MQKWEVRLRCPLWSWRTRVGERDGRFGVGLRQCRVWRPSCWRRKGAWIFGWDLGPEFEAHEGVAWGLR